MLENVQLMSLKEGDVIVYQTSERLTSVAVANIRQQLDQVLQPIPKGVKVMILDAGQSISVLRKEDVKDAG